MLIFMQDELTSTCKLDGYLVLLGPTQKIIPLNFAIDLASTCKATLLDIANKS